MENITLGQIGTFLGLIAGIITSLGIILVSLQKVLKKTIKTEIEPIKEDIKDLNIGQCKNYLVRFLADVEKGKELDEVEKERAYELYDRYTNTLKQNSYIHKRWEELMEVKK